MNYEKLNEILEAKRIELFNEHDKIIKALFFDENVEFATMCENLNAVKPFFEDKEDFSAFVAEKLAPYFPEGYIISYDGEKTLVSIYDDLNPNIYLVGIDFDLRYPFVVHYFSTNYCVDVDYSSHDFLELARCLLKLANGKKVVVSVAYCTYPKAYDLLTAEGCSVA